MQKFIDLTTSETSASSIVMYLRFVQFKIDILLKLSNIQFLYILDFFIQLLFQLATAIIRYV